MKRTCTFPFLQFCNFSSREERIWLVPIVLAPSFPTGLSGFLKSISFSYLPPQTNSAQNSTFNSVCGAKHPSTCFNFGKDHSKPGFSSMQYFTYPYYMATTFEFYLIVTFSLSHSLLISTVVQILSFLLSMCFTLLVFNFWPCDLDGRRRTDWAPEFAWLYLWANSEILWTWGQDFQTAGDASWTTSGKRGRHTGIETCSHQEYKIICRGMRSDKRDIWLSYSITIKLLRLHSNLEEYVEECQSLEDCNNVLIILCWHGGRYFSLWAR